ncbi:hypothetical protein [Pelomonas sp. Root1237]|uniref:hypothetical protein n=1 Tax=Pelomonas sp. Root1237 TaxID=1736434 RepID=UPI0009EB7333|nr:hypothetical protein [Pelomonas sp. Root1237]
MDRMIYLSMAGAKAAMQRQDVLSQGMTHPRSAFGAPPQGGAARGPAKPVPRRPLEEVRRWRAHQAKERTWTA